MKFAADTGSLLSLACSSHFNEIIKEHTIIFPKLVEDELKQFARYDDFLGTKAKYLLRQKFNIKNPKTLLDFKIERAECSVFSLAVEEKCIALTDDVHAARVAYGKLKLNAKPSFYLLLLLYKKKRITKEELIEDFQLILKNRNWLNSALSDYALNLIEKL